MSGSEPAMLGRLIERFEAHEALDDTRHREHMDRRDEDREVLDAVRDLLVEVRTGQQRTIAAWLTELGTDTVALPILGPTKLRTLVVLVGLALGSLTWLGISGESVWTYLTGHAAQAVAPAPHPNHPEPTP